MPVNDSEMKSRRDDNDNDDDGGNHICKNKETSKINSPVDHGWAWMTVLGSFIVNFLVIGAIGNSFGVLMTELQMKYSSSSSQTMGVISLMHMIRCLLAPISSVLAACITGRLTVIIGGIFIFAGFILSLFAAELYALYLTYGVLVGIGASMSFTPGLATVGQFFDRRRALATGLSLTGCGLGTFAAPPLTRYLLDRYSLSSTFLLLGAIMLHICFAGSLFRPLSTYARRRKSVCETYATESDASQKNVDDTQKNGGVGKTTTSRNENSIKRRSLKDKFLLHLDVKLLGNALFLMYATSLMFSFPGLQTFILMLPNHARCLDVSDQYAAFLLSAFGISDVAGRILFGFLADLDAIPRRWLFTGCTALCGVTISVVPWISDYGGMVMLCAVVGVFGGGFLSLMNVIVADRIGVERLFSSIGFVNFFIGASFVVATPFMGFLKDYTGNWKASFLVSGLLMIIGSALLLLDPLVVKYENRKFLYTPVVLRRARMLLCSAESVVTIR